METKVKATVLTSALASALLIAPAPTANAIDCHTTGYPAGTGCVGLPPEFGISDAQASQVKAWSKCLAGITAAGIPYGRAVTTVSKKLLEGAAVVGLSGYATCDLNAIRGR